MSWVDVGDRDRDRATPTGWTRKGITVPVCSLRFQHDRLFELVKILEMM